MLTYDLLKTLVKSNTLTWEELKSLEAGTKITLIVNKEVPMLATHNRGVLHRVNHIVVETVTHSWLYPLMEPRFNGPFDLINDSSVTFKLRFMEPECYLDYFKRELGNCFVAILR